MKDLKLTFVVDEMPFYAVSYSKSIEIQTDKDQLHCKVQYDSHSDPLVLKGGVKQGDGVSVVLMKHRIELYVNGALVDEEWPMGKRLFEMGDSFEPDAISAEEYIAPPKEVSSVLGEFYGAEGWKPAENVFVGDCMPYVRGDEYHVLYLKDRHHHYSKWGMGAHQWEHISTKDFTKWYVHPMAVEITDPAEGSICTASFETVFNSHQNTYLLHMHRLLDTAGRGGVFVLYRQTGRNACGTRLPQCIR